MVAFQDAQSALAWSLDVQDALLLAEWPDDILQQKSGEVVLSPDKLDTDGQPLALFRGLRVRIGMHTGFPELEYNERTNGVDYFGPVVHILLLRGATSPISSVTYLTTYLLYIIYYNMWGWPPPGGTCSPSQHHVVYCWVTGGSTWTKGESEIRFLPSRFFLRLFSGDAFHFFSRAHTFATAGQCWEALAPLSLCVRPS